MDPIPQPQLLDPDRLLDPERDEMTVDHEARATMYEDGLRESCAYGQQLWQALDSVREYLMNSLPPDPRAPGKHVTCASPIGPDDEEGWTKWIDTFSAVTSAMCGPRGDSGYGYAEAKHAADVRRDVPRQPGAPQPPAAVAPGEHQAVPVADTSAAPPPEQAVGKPFRAVATGVLVVLAARGLVPRRRTKPTD